MTGQRQRAYGGRALTIRPLGPDDDLETELDLRHRAFGPISGGYRDAWLAELRALIGVTAVIGAWDGDVLVGSARILDMRQWWGGRALRMGGISGVKVAPEARGQGIGRALMTEVLAVLSERGYQLSVLYPATAHIYRSLGWEIAGGGYRATIPGRSLTSLVPPDPQLRGDPEGRPPGRAQLDEPGAESGVALRRAGPDDADEVVAVLGAVHAAARTCGPCTRDPATVRRWLTEPDLFAYLAADGVLGYGWWGDGDRDILVHFLQAVSEQTTRALWGIVASHASVTEMVHVNVGLDDPVCWLTRELDGDLRLRDSWMLRVIEAGAAIAGRGFPASVETDIPLVLADPDLPANAGTYRLTVSGGRGKLSPAITQRPTALPAAGPVRLGPRGFAALFAGVPMATLRRAGLAAGGDAQADALLDGAFAATPFMLDYF